MDTKMARGYARQNMRPLDAAGRAMRIRNFRAAHALSEIGMAGSKLKLPRINVMTQALSRAAAASPATLSNSWQRADQAHHDCNFRCSSLLKRPTRRLRSSSDCFDDQEWALAIDVLGSFRRRPFFWLCNPPILFSHHMVERYVERTDDASCSGIMEAMGSSVHLATVQLEIAQFAGRYSGALIIPAPGGVLLGQIEPVSSPELGLILMHNPDIMTTSVTVSHSNINLTASLRTFVHEDQLGTAQAETLYLLNSWVEKHLDDLQDDDWIEYGAEGDWAKWVNAFGDLGERIDHAFSPREAKSLPMSREQFESLQQEGRRFDLESSVDPDRVYKEVHARIGGVPPESILWNKRLNTSGRFSGGMDDENADNCPPVK